MLDLSSLVQVVAAVILLAVHRYVNARRPANSFPYVPSWIPFFGASFHFRHGPMRVLQAYTATYGPVFNLTVLGKTITYVTDATLFPPLVKCPALGLFPLKIKFYERVFGSTSHDDPDVFAFLAKHTRQNILAHLSGTSLAQWTAKSHALFQRQVAEGGFGDEFDVSVYAWLAPKVFATLLDTFYGKGLCTPQLAHDFDLLESKIVALYAGAPATLLKVTEPRQRLHEALREYIEAHTDTGQCPLLDSAVKETLRLRFSGSVLRVAVAHATVDLPNGTQLRMQPGDEIMLWGGLGYHDPSRFHNPDDFQFDRFARYPDLAKDFRPFGLGKFNCPGQFFAVEFLKVALATLMLDTEISQFEGSASPNYTTAGVFAPKDAEAVRMCIRRRVFMADHPTMDETSNGCVSCA
ncbi:hypothetical protein DYB30_001701 [Aphanomyces astaci]|uniref:Cytochrome P450 n=2 Tax=Aphanomyces astaci TaxID=112090 RepID=A0A397C838_APHAT|nr:hypothetical protein DYB30_001701 [Aphanomyces astaci]RHY91696.1 hypothetical protein DYB26_002550 [Aphanomyces astaci]